MEDFKTRIKKLREENKLTYSQIANIFDKSEGAIRAWEGGRTKPDADTLIRIAKYFNVTTDFLLGMSDAKNPETADVMKVTGLTEKAVETLKYCINRSKYNSITLTVNTLLENKYALGSISHYLYYNMYEQSDVNEEPVNVISFGEKYKYLYSDPNKAWSNDEKTPIDFDVSIEAFTNEKYKKLLMLNVQEKLEKLLKQEEEIVHFE